MRVKSVGPFDRGEVAVAVTVAVHLPPPTGSNFFLLLYRRLGADKLGRSPFSKAGAYSQTLGLVVKVC